MANFSAPNKLSYVYTENKKRVHLKMMNDVKNMLKCIFAVPTSSLNSFLTTSRIVLKYAHWTHYTLEISIKSQCTTAVQKI